VGVTVTVTVGAGVGDEVCAAVVAPPRQPVSARDAATAIPAPTTARWTEARALFTG
jgi:hypothetical protein